MAHDFEKKWRSQDVHLKENADFSSLLLNDRILHGLTKAGFKKPSPIQLEAIPLGLFGKDLLVQAKSGTGKTLVFVTIALQMLRSRLFRPQILVLAPTREIATQIESVVKLVGSAFPKLICHSFIGGLSVRDDTEKTASCQFVVGTPGRIKQLITLKALSTNSIRLLVFDEADQLFHKTFKEDIDAIFKSLPEVKQVIATSATYPPKTLKLITEYLSDPSVVCLNARELALLGIVHYAKEVKFVPMPLMLYNNKLAALEEILKSIKFSQCLVFCNGIHRVEVLYRDIKKWGFSATYISSKKEQCDRLKAIDKLKHFKCKVLVSSDLTARGIDAENVDLVVNFDLSFNTETYMHRVGRAGRYGSIGVAITLIDENEINNLKRIEDEASFKSFKLPDPVPRDLIVNPSFENYFIPKLDLSDSFSETNEMDKNEFICNDEVKEKLQTKNLETTTNEENNITNGDNGHSEVVKEKLHAKNLETTSNEENHITNGDSRYSEVNSPERDVAEAVGDKDNLNKTDELSSREDANYEINTFGEHDLEIKRESGSNGSLETETLHIKITEKITSDESVAATALHTKQNKMENKSFFVNGDVASDCVTVESVTEDTVSKGKKMGELTSSDLFKETEVTDFNSSGNTNNSHAESSPKHDKNNQIIIKPKDVQLDISNEDKFEKNELENINKTSESEIIENVSDLSENKDTAVIVKEDVNVKHVNNLKHAIKMFIDKFEVDESVKFTSKDKEYRVMKEENLFDGSDNRISDSMLRDLCIQKNKYFYNIFKKFDEKDNFETPSGENRLNENLDNTPKSFQNDFSEQEKSVLNVTDETKSLVVENVLKVLKDLNIESTKNCLGKPNYESTPQTSKKANVENITHRNDEHKSKTETDKKLILLTQQNSNESESSETHSDIDSDLSDKVSSLVKQHPSLEDSESISDQDSADDESEKIRSGESEKIRSGDESELEKIRPDDERSSTSSDSSPSSSSSSSASYLTGNVYLDMLDTGRRNPSLLMNSSENSIGLREGDTKHAREQKYQRHYNTRFRHTSKQPKYANSNIPRSAGASTRRQQVYEDNYINSPQINQEHLACPRHHSLKCFLPSAHRCHPNTTNHTCSQKPLCDQWYNEFYRQWYQIQNMSQ